jgi:threonine dehydrogenase-like Zn-dependent dehydrogenase
MPAAAAEAADVVIHTSGAEAGLATALDLAGFEARVIEMSWYGAGRIGVALGEKFHSRRLSLRSSQVGAIAPAQRGRWSTQRRMALVLRLLADSALDAVITAEGTFEDLPAIMQRLAEAPGAALCQRISFG